MDKLSIVIGYGFNTIDVHPMPIFSNEGYKGVVYPTLDEAIKAFKNNYLEDIDGYPEII